MDRTEQIPVMGKDGPLGWIDPTELAKDESDVLIHLPNGDIVMAPVGLLQPLADQGFYLPLEHSQVLPGIDGAVSRQESSPTGETESRRVSRETVTVIPLAAEQVHVEKQATTRPVHIRKRVLTKTERIEDAGYQEEIMVERAPVHEWVEEAPAVRTEGNTTIIPVVEEVLVVEKRLFLREEVRITMTRVDHEPIEVELRAEDIEILRPGETGHEASGDG